MIRIILTCIICFGLFLNVIHFIWKFLTEDCIGDQGNFWMTCNIIYFPESVPVTTTPKVLLPAAPVALPKYNFNSEACSGCFLKKSPPKTEIRTLSQPLAPVQPGKPDGSSDIGLNVQLPFRESIAQTVASRLGLLQDTLQTSNTNTNAPNTKTIELGLNLAMSTYYTTKNAVTGHVSTQTSTCKLRVPTQRSTTMWAWSRRLHRRFIGHWTSGWTRTLWDKLLHMETQYLAMCLCPISHLLKPHWFQRVK